MTAVITSLCAGVCDTQCVDVCPVDCIAGPVPLEEVRAVPKEERGEVYPGYQLYVDPDECICCMACLAVCPAGAIFMEDDVPAEYRGDIEANARFYELG